MILQVERKLQDDPSVLSQLYVTSNSGSLVPLSAVASFDREPQALTVNHQGQLPAVTVSFNLAQGVSLSDAVTHINDTMGKLGLPATISGSVQGTAQAFQQSMQGMGMLLLLAVFVIYLVLGILYESFIHPLTILSGLPAAAVGALLTLVLFHASLDLFAFVGIVMLIGIVKKNAIMLIDFALERQRDEGMSPAQAIVDACRVRFRPIMMTTMAAMAGTLPIALGYRCRRGSAPLAGPGRGRRPGVLADPHAVPDAGDLRRHGPAAAALSAVRQGPAGALACRARPAAIRLILRHEGANMRSLTLAIVAFAAAGLATIATASTGMPAQIDAAALQAWAGRPWDKAALMNTTVDVGRYRGVPVVAEFPCSDVCPQYTVRIIHYQLPPGASCAGVGGVEKQVLVPVAITVLPKTFCIPEPLAASGLYYAK